MLLHFICGEENCNKAWKRLQVLCPILSENSFFTFCFFFCTFYKKLDKILRTKSWKYVNYIFLWNVLQLILCNFLTQLVGYSPLVSLTSGVFFEFQFPEVLGLESFGKSRSKSIANAIQKNSVFSRSLVALRGSW